MSLVLTLLLALLVEMVVMCGVAGLLLYRSLVNLKDEVRDLRSELRTGQRPDRLAV